MILFLQRKSTTKQRLQTAHTIHYFQKTVMILIIFVQNKSMMEQLLQTARTIRHFPEEKAVLLLFVQSKLMRKYPLLSCNPSIFPLPIFPSSPGGHSPFPVILDHDSRHFDLSPPLSKGYKDNLGGMTDISIEEIQSLAHGHRKRRKLTQVESEYIRLVNFLGEQNVCDSAAIFERLAQLADIYQARNKVSKSVIAYRRVLDGYRKIFGPSALETLRIVHSLGKVLEENNEYEEAEACYRLAITGFEELGSSGVLDRLNCQSFLGDLLSDMGRHQEALEVLLPTLTGYKDLRLHHRRISILGSLLEINISIKCRPTVDALIRDMQNSLDERINIDYKSFPEVLVEAIHLGSVYFQLLEYKLAESLMSQVIPKLELLDDATYEMEKIYAYIEYGKANLRLDCLEQAECYIQLAKNGLEKLNRYDDAVVSFVDTCLVELEFRSLRPRTRTALSKETLTQMIKGSTESQDTDSEVICEGSRIRGEDGTDVDTSSHKSGVTISMTSITGHSISQFLPA
jgi:tetratricopeptide (TPR) repeat protein